MPLTYANLVVHVIDALCSCVFVCLTLNGSIQRCWWTFVVGETRRSLPLSLSSTLVLSLLVPVCLLSNICSQGITVCQLLNINEWFVCSTFIRTLCVNMVPWMNVWRLCHVSVSFECQHFILSDTCLNVGCGFVEWTHSHSLSLIYCCCMTYMIHRNIHIAHLPTYLLCSVYLSTIIAVYNAVAALLFLTCYAITSMFLSHYARHPLIHLVRCWVGCTTP